MVSLRPLPEWCIEPLRFLVFSGAREAGSASSELREALQRHGEVDTIERVSRYRNKIATRKITRACQYKGLAIDR